MSLRPPPEAVAHLRAALPRLPLNRTLVTIKTDVALELPAKALSLRPRDVDTLRTLYARYGFNAALRELDGNAISVDEDLTDRFQEIIRGR